ncbi:hypothetical protein [Sutterella wadsworthensis]|uniref:hypothetical protein n=1 Tax=Sutterella wadsworthensis TaxID=40545 RepID=UPI00241F5A5C|nr:hypothetical protein [Sutterella wadsworthensis]
MEAVVIEGFEKKGYVLRFVREGTNRFAVLLWFNDELKSAEYFDKSGDAYSLYKTMLINLRETLA